MNDRRRESVYRPNEVDLELGEDGVCISELLGQRRRGPSPSAANYLPMIAFQN